MNHAFYQDPQHEDMPQGLWNKTTSPALHDLAMDFDIANTYDFINSVEDAFPIFRNDDPLDDSFSVAVQPLRNEADLQLSLDEIIGLWPEASFPQQAYQNVNAWGPSPEEMPIQLPAAPALPYDEFLELDSLARDFGHYDDLAAPEPTLFLTPFDIGAAAYPTPSASSSATHSTGHPSPSSSTPTSPSPPPAHPSSQQPFACPDCPRSFARGADLNKHVKKHTKPFRCPVCARGHSAKKDMNRHIEDHHPDEAGRLALSSKRRCAVPGCDMAAVLQRTDNLKRHMETRHPGWREGPKARRRRG